MPLTVGTAGHIDHGKTWLVRALTGKDTDRLPEEQRRGISIDRGVVTVTKADAVDEETLELALAEARELVPEAAAVAVSAKTGAGLDELRAALARLEVEPRDASAAARLYVDRV